MSLVFKKCTLKDLDSLIEVSKTTFIDAFEALNNPEDFERYIAKAFKKEEIKKQLTTKNSTFYFVYQEQELIGYIKLNEREAQKEQFDMNALELERIYVLKEHQGKQFGAKILDEVLSMAKAKNTSFIWLGVWEQNKAAIRFYQNHGFKKFGQHPYLIGEDEQYDWLMKRQFT